MQAEFSLFKRRGGHRQRFIFDKSHGSRCKRFELLQQAIVGHAGDVLNDSARFSGMLIALEGIATAADWQAAYSAVGTRHVFEGRCRLSWVDAGGHPDARMLCSITVAQVNAMGKCLDFEEARQELWSFLRNQRIYPSTSTLDDVLQDAANWLHANVGTMFAAHASGASRLTPLPDSAFARAACKLPLRHDEPNPDEPDTTESVEAEDLLSECMEAALLGRKAEMGSDESFLTALLKALAPPARAARGVQRSTIRGNLRRLTPALANVSEAAALLFAYAWELVTAGTLLKDRAAPGTVRAYVAEIAQGVLAAFAESPISQLSDDEYKAKFECLVAEVGDSAPRLAALRGFHRFLRSWWNAPALSREVLGRELEHSVAANIVWPHELDIVHSWLAATSEVRVHEQARVALMIGRHGPVRATEVLFLRCRNVIVEDDQVIIEIARDPVDGKEKSAEGRRRICIQDPDAVRLLASWLERRIVDEAALPGDYLFGEPSDAKIVHRRGHMYYLMNWLLKVATGDDTVSFHTLRHTFVTIALHGCWMARTESEVDQAAQIATDVGHIGAHVSARWYGHMFEEPLRDRIDRAVFATLPASALASWAACTHDAMRQALSRGVRKTMQAGSGDPVGARLAVVNRLLGERELAAVPSSFARFCAAEPPISPLSVRRTAPSMLTVWGVLADVAAGMSLRSAALRQAVSLECVRNMVSLVGQFAERHGRYGSDRVTHDLHGQAALVDRTGSLLGFRVAFRADLTRRLSLPDASKSTESQNALRDACEYWRRNIHGEQLAASATSSLLRPFLLALKSLQIPATALSIRTCTDPNTETASDAAPSMTTSIQAAFGMSAPIVRTRRRAGRAAAYLVVSLNSEKPCLRGHGASMLWFHSLMLAASVWLEYLKENPIAV